MGQLIAERLTGIPTEIRTTHAMQWGIDTEPQARADYELYTGVVVETVGFISHPRVILAGASPDGLVGNDGLVEIKCPNTATHIDTLLGQSIDGDYIKQMQWQLACCDRQWCDFVSYDPRMPVEMQMFIQRVLRDDKLSRELESDVRAFLRELDEKITALQALHARAA